MFILNRLFLSICFLLIFNTVQSFAAIPIIQTTSNGSLAPMLKNVLPGVVNIAVRGERLIARNTLKNQPQPTPERYAAKKFDDLGSGVIVDAEHGYVLTNAHLIKDAQIIMVVLKDGRRIRGKIIGMDLPSDIAVIQITGKYFTALKFGDSDKLAVGDFVAAIGSPFGLQQTVTSGVVSGLERGNLGIEGYENFIQTDAPINPGNSGGALVNMHGELIGINTAILSTSPVGGSVGIGFAIPSNMAQSVMEQLIKYGKVERGILGVVVQNVTPALAGAMNLTSSEGALVSQVFPNSPAEKVGIKIRDIITKLNGKPIRDAFQVGNSVSLMWVGTKIELEILRQNKKINIQTTIASRDQFKQAVQEKARELLAGLILRNFNQLVNNEQIIGVEVLYVDDMSIAASSGLMQGDIILSAADKPIRNIKELQAIAKSSLQRLLLEIRRGSGGNVFLVLAE